jgi:hypothetical protein
MGRQFITSICYSLNLWQMLVFMYYAKNCIAAIITPSKDSLKSDAREKRQMKVREHLPQRVRDAVYFEIKRESLRKKSDVHEQTEWTV